MNPPALIFAAMALVPAMTGPLPELVRDGTIIVALCGGGTVALPLGGQPAPPGEAPCCAKGCHSERKRRRFDAGQ